MHNSLMSRDDREALAQATKEYWVRTQQYFTPDAVDDATQSAITLIAQAGFDEQDSDQLGDACGDVLQTVLTIALLRLPQLDEQHDDGDDSDDDFGFTIGTLPGQTRVVADED